MRNYRAFSARLDLDGTPVPARIYVMRAPTSYTREDIVELHTFGNPALQRGLLDRLTSLGARPAEAGEFTRRAFLNGRIDLAQAESVEALIHARSQAQYRAALNALGGGLSRRIRAIRARVVELSAAVETSLDFSDHDVPCMLARGNRRAPRADLRRDSPPSSPSVAKAGSRIPSRAPCSSARPTRANPACSTPCSGAVAPSSRRTRAPRATRSRPRWRCARWNCS